MEKEAIVGPYGEWCVVSVPEYCESGLRIARYEDGNWMDDEGVDITQWVKGYRIAPNSFKN